MAAQAQEAIMGQPRTPATSSSRVDGHSARQEWVCHTSSPRDRALPFKPLVQQKIKK